MKCAACQNNGTRVVASLPIDGMMSTRTRRGCASSGYRFTTSENVEEMPLIGVTKAGSREEISRQAALSCVIRAREKRPVSLEVLEEVVFTIEKDLRRAGNPEVKSEEVGELVMNRLATIDEVAYVRFASVYRQFKDITVFIDELKDLLNKSPEDKKSE